MNAESEDLVHIAKYIPGGGTGPQGPDSGTWSLDRGSTVWAEARRPNPGAEGLIRLTD